MPSNRNDTLGLIEALLSVWARVCVSACHVNWTNRGEKKKKRRRIYREYANTDDGNIVRIIETQTRRSRRRPRACIVCVHGQPICVQVRTKANDVVDSNVIKVFGPAERRSTRSDIVLIKPFIFTRHHHHQAGCFTRIYIPEFSRTVNVEFRQINDEIFRFEMKCK